MFSGIILIHPHAVSFFLIVAVGVPERLQFHISIIMPAFVAPPAYKDSHTPSCLYVCVCVCCFVLVSKWSVAIVNPLKQYVSKQNYHGGPTKSAFGFLLQETFPFWYASSDMRCNTEKSTYIYEKWASRFIKGWNPYILWDMAQSLKREIVRRVIAPLFPGDFLC